MNTNQNSKTNLIEKILIIYLALSLTACSVTSVSTPSPSVPPATEAIPTPTEIAIELEGEVFSTTENLPKEIIPSMYLFKEMAQSDGLTINKLHPILWLKAAQGELSVNYALLQVAIVSDLTDADGEPGNPKPVYYIAYQDQQGQMQGGYVLGKLIEKDSQGVSYVARILDETTFRQWQNNTQPEDGSYTVGQVVYSVPLREDISVEQARTMQAKLNSGELSSKDFMENYAEGVAFIQPGQEKQVVGKDKDKSTPELIAKPFWQELFSGVTEAQAADLEFSSEPEPTPTVEPTLSPEQALAEFKESAEYKQGLQDYLNAMGLKVENVITLEEVKVINGQEHRFLVAIPDQTKLTPEQQKYADLFGAVPLFILSQNEQGEWGWRKSEWHDITNVLIGVEIDPGHPNDHEVAYRNFVVENTNYFVVSGAMSHQWLQYGVKFTPEMVHLHKKNNPESPLTLGIGHLFYHHDTFPDNLSNSEIPLNQRQELTKQYMRQRIREVLDVLAPLMNQYPDLTVQFNLGNEVVWEYQGNTGWEGEYSDYPLYDNLGKDWLVEGYIAFEEVRESYRLPREKFILLMNDWGIQQPGLKANYYLQQRNWVVGEISKKMCINPSEVQLDIGIQFGMGSGGATDVQPTLRLLQTAEGRKKIIDNLMTLSERSDGPIYFTEVVADNPKIITSFLLMVDEAKKQGLSIGMINFWDSLNSNFDGETIVNKDDYRVLAPYYFILEIFLQKSP
jgi:hypothetical protein